MVPSGTPDFQGDSSAGKLFFAPVNAANARRAGCPQHNRPRILLSEANTLISLVKSEEAPAPAGSCGGLGKAVVGAATFLLTLVFLAAAGSVSARSPEVDDGSTVRVAALPEEARQTLSLIKQGGPFPYARDGVVFANREGRLPPASRGTYREYTVKTPGSRDRGARRIIAAGRNQFWYTADHYRSFRRIVE